MAAENGLWGAPRVHGELLKLGIANFGTDGLAVSARPPANTVTNLAYLLRESLRYPDIYLAVDARRCER